MDREVKIGQVYKHFKGNIVKVIGIAKHTETLEVLVVYKHLVTHDLWARPLGMFLSEVDHEQYPNVEQQYRFELVNPKDLELDDSEDTEEEYESNDVDDIKEKVKNKIKEITGEDE